MKNKVIDFALAILRIGFSGVMLTHGIPKINMLIDNPFGFSDPIGIGAIATLIIAIVGEVVAPVLIIIGYQTRIATIPIIATMATAFFVVHADDAFGIKEKALLFLIAFASIGLAGPGKYSVDGRK